MTWRNELNKNAMGGSELMMDRLMKHFDGQIDDFQIILSRVRELDPNKYRILYLHDLPEDPESAHLANGGWKKFHRLVFCSYWQQQEYIKHFNIPWSRTSVIRNSIEPSLTGVSQFGHAGPIKLIYHTTPHRGLELLVPVFKKLAETHDIELDVYSSFKIYGWEERDKAYEKLFDEIKEHPKMIYHGTVSNEEIRKALTNAHMFLYPNIWKETSCIALIEALSAGLVCIHPSYGALYETGANFSFMYDYHEEVNINAARSYNMANALLNAIKKNPNGLMNRQSNQKTVIDTTFGWQDRIPQWIDLFNDIKGHQPKQLTTKENVGYQTQLSIT